MSVIARAGEASPAPAVFHLYERPAE